MLIKSGDMVGFELNGENTYGNVVWIEGDKAHIDYYDKQEKKFECKPIPLSSVVKIGSHLKIIKNKEQ